MRRQFPGLQMELHHGEGMLEGVFLVRVDGVRYQPHAQKPFFVLRFKVIEPKQSTGRFVSGRLYCTSKALWKLNWFLRDFGYDADLLAHEHVEERSLLGLVGVIKTARAALPGRSLLNLESFAPAAEWEALSGASLAQGTRVDGHGL